MVHHSREFFRGSRVSRWRSRPTTISLTELTTTSLGELLSSMQSGELENTTAPRYRSRALRRSGAAILYVHWEGYCKNVLSAYFDYLLARRIPVRKASDGLAMLMLENCPEASLTRISSGQRPPFAGPGRCGTRISRVRTDDVVNTQSNLRSRVIEDILRKLDLDILSSAPKGISLISRCATRATRSLTAKSIRVPMWVSISA